MKLYKEKVTLKMRVMNCNVCEKHLVKTRIVLEEFDKNGWVQKKFFCNKKCFKKYMADIIEECD